MKSNSLNLRSLCFIFLLSVFNPIIAQESLFKSKKDSLFNNFNKLYQEVVHVHVNKSFYLQGEVLGFTAYVIDRKNNTPSYATKNLYCTISDVNNKVIKKKLIEVKKGIASNIFEIDSSFNTGQYVFKAYTNWMLNFKQQNYFTQKFNVINLEDDIISEKTKQSSKIDLQTLPEGGHLIDDVRTTIGVIAKDSLNLGIPNLEAQLFDNNNQLISSFKLNHLGIGRFSFTPKIKEKYYIKLNFNGIESIFALQNKIEEKGIYLKTTKIRDGVFLSLLTNEKTLQEITNRSYNVSIYNGSELKKISFTFSDKTQISRKIAAKNLSKGINIFTLFDDDANPISERLYFNYKGITFLKSALQQEYQKTSDSLFVSFKYDEFKDSGFNNVSVSILPEETISYLKNNNIISQTLLQPYINGRIQNADYYFTKITPEKEHELDNLLLTQGWSSYDWSDIFNEDRTLNYAFENGINLDINIPKAKDNNRFLFRYSGNTDSNIIQLNNGTTSISSSNYYPEENGSLFVSKMTRKGRLIPTNLYVNFSPNIIPNLKIDNTKLLYNTSYYASENYIDAGLFKNTLKNTQNLDEVVVKVDKKQERIEKIRETAIGNVYTYEDDIGFNYKDIFAFLRTKGFAAERLPASNEVILINLQGNISLNGGNSPTVFLDDFPLLSLQQLDFFPVQTIDYVVINKSGVGEGILGGGGTIRIYTDPYKRKEYDKKTTSVIDFPLTFNNAKQFYTPVYQNYHSSFYKKYGAIDWLPINKINENGYLNLNFKNYKNKALKLFIEGITKDGKFILEEKRIHLD